MRRKKAPNPHARSPASLSSPPKRQRTTTPAATSTDDDPLHHHRQRQQPHDSHNHHQRRLHHWHTPQTDLWAHAEWFHSLMDAPFFTFSEFDRIMHTAMGLQALLPIGGTTKPTRLQLSRVRAAMCNAFPGRYAKPRRLSPAFLAAELDELAMFRADARRVMRGRDLAPATDPATGNDLPAHWASRYCCPKPELPDPQTNVFVRTCIVPPSQRPPSSPSALTKTDTDTDIEADTTTAAAGATGRSIPVPAPVRIPSTSRNVSVNPSSDSMINDIDSNNHNNRNHDTNNSDNSTSPRLHQSSRFKPHPHPHHSHHSQLPSKRVQIRPAVFLGLHADSEIVIRFIDDDTHHIVHDLDVMLMHPTSAPLDSSNYHQQQQSPFAPSSSIPISSAHNPAVISPPRTAHHHHPSLLVSGAAATSTAAAAAAPVVVGATTTAMATPTAVLPRTPQARDQLHSPLSPRNLFSPHLHHRPPPPQPPSSSQMHAHAHAHQQQHHHHPAQPLINDPTAHFLDTPRMGGVSTPTAGHDPESDSAVIGLTSGGSLQFPTPSPFRQFLSPIRPLRSASPQPHLQASIECEVDVQQLGESICILDRKTELLYHLRALNNEVEAARAKNAPLNASVPQRYDSLMTELAVVEDDLRHVLASHVPLNSVHGTLDPTGTDARAVDRVVHSLNFNSPPREGSDGAGGADAGDVNVNNSHSNNNEPGGNNSLFQHNPDQQNFHHQHQQQHQQQQHQQQQHQQQQHQQQQHQQQQHHQQQQQHHHQQQQHHQQHHQQQHLQPQQQQQQHQHQQQQQQTDQLLDHGLQHHQTLYPSVLRNPEDVEPPPQPQPQQQQLQIQNQDQNNHIDNMTMNTNNTNTNNKSNSKESDIINNNQHSFNNNGAAIVIGDDHNHNGSENQQNIDSNSNDGLPAQHLAKNVDFLNATGAATLAKALTRSALAKLPDSNALKWAPTALRADLMECVSACVTVLIRARVTNDFHSIEQVAEAVPLRYPENSEALEAIHSAARMFDSSCTDSV